MALNSRTFFGTTFLVFIIDQLTKQWAQTVTTNVPIIPDVLHLRLVWNTGAVFGILKNTNILLSIITIIAVTAIIVFRQRIIHDRNESIAWGAIVGGGLGNLTNRLMYGAVIDFIDFRIWPAFNIADTAITCSIIYLIAKETFLTRHKKKKKA